MRKTWCFHCCLYCFLCVPPFFCFLVVLRGVEYITNDRLKLQMQARGRSSNDKAPQFLTTFCTARNRQTAPPHKKIKTKQNPNYHNVLNTITSKKTGVNRSTVVNLVDFLVCAPVTSSSLCSPRAMPSIDALARSGEVRRRLLRAVALRNCQYEVGGHFRNESETIAREFSGDRKRTAPKIGTGLPVRFSTSATAWNEKKGQKGALKEKREWLRVTSREKNAGGHTWLRYTQFMRAAMA